MVSVLKEGAVSNLMAVLEVKSEVPEVVYVVDMEGTSTDKPRAKGHAPVAASTSSLVLPLSCYAHATHAALVFLGVPPDFKLWHAFELHIQEVYGGFRWN